jgi:hypothetical protein
VSKKFHVKHPCSLITTLFLIFMLHASTLFAGDVTLSWIPPTLNNDGSPVTDLAGYNVYFGIESRDYSQSIDVGNTTSYQDNTFIEGYTYFFAVTAYDTSGNESEFSHEVNKTLPYNDIYIDSEADASVSSGSPYKNYGSSNLLEIDKTPSQITYIRFNVSGLSGSVQSAYIRLDCVNSSQNGGTIHALTDNSWNEDNITYNNRPFIDGPALDSLGKVLAGNAYEFDVTSVIDGNGTYSFAITSDNSDGADYRSREDLTNPPVLIISTGGDLINSPPEIYQGPTAEPNPIYEDETAEFSVQAMDADGDLLTYTWVAEGGTITGSGDTVIFTPPDIDDEQTFSIAVKVTDGQGGYDEGTMLPLLTKLSSPFLK